VMVMVVMGRVCHGITLLSYRRFASTSGLTTLVGVPAA